MSMRRLGRGAVCVLSLLGAVSAEAETVPDSMHQLTLDNGLAVVWEEDHRQPLVAIEARIRGGLRGEGAYLGTGITHAIEHMLFKGTTSREPGMIDQEVRRYGGHINAFTSPDTTGVNLFVDAAYLPQALEMLSDILQHATFPEEEFVKERQVIISEIHMNQDDPDRRLHHLFWNHHFLVHPYQHPILGYQSRLEGLTVNELRALYRAQYVPNNVVLACAGAINSATFPKLVADTFGHWPRGAPYQVTVPAEPPVMSAKTRVEALPVQAAYSMIGFPSVRLADPDLYALDVLATIVGQGRSSRLHEALVRTQRLAHMVGASNYTPLDPGLFLVSMRTDPAKAEAAIDAVQAILETVARKGVTAHELAKAKRQVAADYVFSHQTIEAKADDLANSYATTGDPRFSTRYVEGVERVTAEQIQRVAQRYLNTQVRTVVTIRPPAAAAPTTPAAATATLPMKKTVLANGLTVLVGPDQHVPMMVITVVARGGVRAETEQTQGLSSLVAQLLTKGTARLSASAIAEWVESRGGQLEAFSGREGFGLVLQLLAEDTEAGVGLVHELLTTSTFPQDELELQRQLTLQELHAREDDVFDVGGRLLRQTLFTSHPYRFDPLGTVETVSRFSRAECQAFATKWLIPRTMIVAIVGDVREQSVLEQTKRLFERLPSPPDPWPQQLTAEPLESIRQAERTVPKEQSVIFLGFRGTRIVAEDRDSLDVLAAILSGMSGRLFQAVREEQGLSYTIGAANVPGWDQGYIVLYAATRPQEETQVLETMRTQVQAVVDTGVTAEELEQAKRSLIGNHRIGLQHVAGVAKRCALDELYGLGFEAWRSYEARINAVTLPMVQHVARHYLTLPKRAEVVVRPAAAQAPAQALEPAAVPQGARAHR